MTSMEIHNIIEKCKRLGFTGLTIEELIESFIIYLRKSRSDEEVERYIKMSNPDITKEELDKEILKRHENQIQAYAKETLGFRIPEKCIKREIVSGGELEDRLVMKEIMLEIEDPKILGVFVVDIDRIGRPDALDTGLLIQAFELTDTKIFVASPPKIWDLTNEFDKEYFEDSLRQARKFLNYTKTKMTNGRKASVKEGKFIGNTAPFGYDRYKLPDQKGWSLKPNDDAKYVIDMFMKYVYEGYSFVAIANYLNKEGIKPPVKQNWQPAMIKGILNKEVYAGYVTYGKNAMTSKLVNGKKVKKRQLQEEYLKCKGLHDALVDEETFDKVKEVSKDRAWKNVPKHETLQNPLVGLIKCNCGYVMSRGKTRIAKNLANKDDLNAEKFVSYFQERKKALNLNNTQISKLTGISVGALKHYSYLAAFSFPRPNNYIKLKEVMQMDDRFDAILQYQPTFIDRSTLYCSNNACKCISSPLDVVEKELLKKLKEKIQESNTFLDNYEQDEIQVIKDNKKEIDKLQKDIDGLKNQISVACDLLERKMYTDEMFMNRINSLNSDIAIKEEKIKQLEELKVEKEIIQHKKQVPVLENVISIYDKLSIEEKNELLKTFINKIYYWKETKASQTTLKGSGEITLNIDFKEF